MLSIISHIPRIAKGKRVFSEEGKFWTKKTIALHLLALSSLKL